MNRYLVRSLVAILAFFIGVAVSSAFRPAAKYRHWKYDRDCYRKKAERGPRHHGNYSRFRTASVSVDTVASDPLKLAYSNTNDNARLSGHQRVEFSATSFSKKDIERYTVSYSAWARSSYKVGSSELGDEDRSIVMDSDDRNGNLRSGLDEIVGIECYPFQSLTVWVSSVEFTDGSRWTNPRH